MRKNDLRKTILISCYGGLGESKCYINIFDIYQFFKGYDQLCFRASHSRKLTAKHSGTQ